MHAPEYHRDQLDERHEQALEELLDGPKNRTYILNRWWTLEELQAEATRIDNKESRYSASGRAKILKAVGR